MLSPLVLSADELAARMADPVTYPCFSESLQGKHRGGGCRCIGCILPAMTPSDKGTPGYAAQLASVDSSPEALLGSIQQPSFGCEPVEETPDETIFTHNVVSGLTPSTASSATRNNIRVEVAHAGVPVHSQSTPVHLTTPSRDKSPQE